MKKLIPKHQLGTKTYNPAYSRGYATTPRVARVDPLTQGVYPDGVSYSGKDYFIQHGTQYGRNLVDKGVQQTGVPINYEDGYLAPAQQGDWTGYLVTRPQTGGWERFIPTWAKDYERVNQQYRNQKQ